MTLVNAGAPQLDSLEGVRVLVLDDDEVARSLFQAFLEHKGAQVVAVEDKAAALRALAALGEQAIDVAIVDKNLPDGSGLEVVEAARERGLDIEIVLVSAHATVSSAVSAMQLGVGDYVLKPVDDLDDFAARVQRVVATLRLRRENQRLFEELKRKTATLEAMVVREPLTGLFNHKHLQEILAQEIERARRGQSPCFSLLFIDIDHFKRVNDTLGHQTGDALLRRFARMLMDGGRPYDLGFRGESDEALAARYGGDEFTLVLPGTSKAGAAVKAERFRTRVGTADFSDLGVDALSVSVGVAGFPEDACDRDGLVRAADAALYAAKRAGRDRVVSYSPWLTTKSEVMRSGADHYERGTALLRVLERCSLRYEYQPIVYVDSLSLCAYEALCRPVDEVFKDPALLFEVAEGSGRVAELGRLAREVALGALRDLPLTVSLFVNLHPLEVTPQLVREVVERYGELSTRLVFEITEGARIHDWARARAVSDALRAHGCRIAVDDLGAGYAGLSALVKLRPDFVKLDATLVHGLAHDSGTARLIRHVLEFAAGEGARVIAEGVETREHLDAVAQVGCSLAQGYFIARPGPPFPVLDEARLRMREPA